MAEQPQGENRHRGDRVLSVRAMVLTGVGLLCVGVVAVVVLLWQFGSATEGDSVRLDAVRTAASIVLGTGGVAALALAARRQRATELDLVQKQRSHALQAQAHADTTAHQERVAEATERDAEERRVTELYGRAVDQLGSEKAPVRLGGLYALERLAQHYPPHRQTIVNVLCAYLRMPYHPTAPEPGDSGPGDQELQVRLTAQDIFARHLRDGDPPAESFWPNVDLHLAGAHVTNLDLAACRIRSADFSRATFDGETLLDAARFTGRACFQATRFRGRILAKGARFDAAAEFQHARFEDYAGFDDARFDIAAEFSWADFDKAAWFPRAALGSARFHKTKFGGPVEFTATSFSGPPVFDLARAGIDPDLDDRRTWPRGYGVLSPVTADHGHVPGEAGLWGYVSENPER